MNHPERHPVSFDPRRLCHPSSRSHLSSIESSVSRVWRHFGIQPHRLRGYMAGDDPEFEEKAADIIGL
jgi:transposase